MPTATVEEKPHGHANFLQVYFVGHCVYWSIGLIQGFWEFFLSTMILSLAFFALCMCLAEMISILPFGGGAYGFSRVTMGPYLGFMVGFFDSISNIIYVIIFVRTFAILFAFCFKLTYEEVDSPYLCLLVYAGIIVMQVLLGKYNFNFFSFMGVVVLAIPIIFILGTINQQDFQVWVVDQENLYQHKLFPYGSKGFLQIFPISGLLYFGIDMMCLITEDTKNAVTVVPYAIMAVFATIFALAIALIFSVSSQYPGVVWAPYVPLPLTYGFATLFKTSLEKATWTVLPSSIMEVYGLMYAFGRQMCALSRSGLLPKCFSWTTSSNVPYMSVILGSVAGLLILIILQYADKPKYERHMGSMYYVAQMCSITVYIISLLSFCVFRYKYSVLERHFNIRWAGIPLAIFGMGIFFIMFVMLGFYQEDYYFIIKCYTVLFAIGTLYYVLYARRHQTFSQEEQSILFAVYVIKANSRHRTVYRWMEKKFNKHLGGVLTYNGSGQRSSGRNSGKGSRSRVTPGQRASQQKSSDNNSSSQANHSGGQTTDDVFKTMSNSYRRGANNSVRQSVREKQGLEPEKGQEGQQLELVEVSRSIRTIDEARFTAASPEEPFTALQTVPEPEGEKDFDLDVPVESQVKYKAIPAGEVVYVSYSGAPAQSATADE